MFVKLDYTLESPEERKALVEQIIAETPDISPSYLEVLADYLIIPMERRERKERKILTDNRMATVTKRETSFEGLASQLENGEDGIYNMMNENKNTLLSPKISITQHDLDTIPCLKQLRDTISTWEAKAKRTTGRQAFIMKKALIEMRKDQYLIKQAYQKPIAFNKITRGSKTYIPLDDTSYLDGSKVVVQGISLMDPKVVSAILCNYSHLKQDSYDSFSGDMWYLLQDFDNVSTIALKDYPIYRRIVELKVDKMQNQDIQKTLQSEFDTTYSIEYISSLWRNKIPKLIAGAAMCSFVEHEYRRRGHPMKKCTKCGQIKPAHNQFFSKNTSAADGWYSVCKECRRKKRG